MTFVSSDRDDMGRSPFSNKPTYKLPQRANRPFKKNPDKIDSLMTGALKRHGIGAQVQAAMIVKRANELLDELIREQHRGDVRVVSYKQNELHVACRHAQARYMINGVQDRLQAHVEQHFPSVTISQVFCRIDPHLLDSTSELS